MDGSVKITVRKITVGGIDDYAILANGRRLDRTSSLVSLALVGVRREAGKGFCAMIIGPIDHPKSLVLGYGPSRPAAARDAYAQHVTFWEGIRDAVALIEV